MTCGLSWAEFDALFQRFADSPTSTTVFRWEAHPRYAIPTDEPSLVAFREGTPRPERSVRTSPWLARIATSTVAGKSWTRVRHVSDSTDEYLRWELVAYVESQAVGERILLTDDDIVTKHPDAWRFCGTNQDDNYAAVMHYTDEGAVDDIEYVHDPDRLERMDELRAVVEPNAFALNIWLATRRGVNGAA